MKEPSDLTADASKRTDMVADTLHQPSPEAHLVFSDVRKEYGEVVAIKSVNLEIQQGEFFTLLGPSGSGKTTLLMALAGFVALTSGDISVDGKSITGIPPQQRDLGVVFQNYALFPHMTVAENLAFPLTTRRLHKRDIYERVNAILELIGLPDRGNVYPSQLSGGQQQRVAVARAIVFEPHVLLMDEPLGALDKNMRAHMQLELRHLQKELGITTIYVTHDQDEAFVMSDRLAIMRDGRIEQVGAPNAIYEDPANLFVANFVGDNNVLEGRVKRVAEHATTVEIAGIGEVECGESTLSPHSPVSVTVRPERISLHPLECPANELRARVKEVIYNGSAIRYQLELEGGQECWVRASNGPLVAPMAEGSRTTVWIATGDFRVFDAR